MLDVLIEHLYLQQHFGIVMKEAKFTTTHSRHQRTSRAAASSKMFVLFCLLASMLFLDNYS